MHISTSVKTVTVATKNKHRVIQVKWSHKEFSSETHHQMTGAIRVDFNENENYSVKDVINKFKSKIVSQSWCNEKDFEDCLEDLALPTLKKKCEWREDCEEPATVIDQFCNKSGEPCSIWEYAKIHKNGRYFTLYLLTEELISKEANNNKVITKSKSVF